jgi:replicative DNA helicase
MSELKNTKKIVKLCLDTPECIDQFSASKITPDHLIDQAESRESKILSKIYNLVQQYFVSSGGSGLTDEVFNDRIAGASIKEQLKADIIAQWVELKGVKVRKDDLHHLVEECKSDYANKKLNESLSNLREDLTEKGIQESIQRLQRSLEVVNQEFIALDTEKTNFDLRTRGRQFIEEYLARFVNKDFDGIPSGIDSLDEKTGGWFPNQLNVFVAPTSGGKSVQLMCSAIAGHAAGNNVLYFSFEMDGWVCELRHLSNIFGIPFNDLKRMTIDDKTRDDLFARYSDYKSDYYFEYDVSIEDPTPEYIESRLRELKNDPAKGVPSLVVVDYIGNMRSRNSPRQDHWKNVGDASDGLFRLAKQYNTTIITAQQMNRATFTEMRQARVSGKEFSLYQDAASGDQRLIQSCYYCIGIEPDKKNNLITYHPIKMRDAGFDNIIAQMDPDCNRIINLTLEEQLRWMREKGLSEAEMDVKPRRPDDDYPIVEEEEDYIESW